MSIDPLDLITFVRRGHDVGALVQAISEDQAQAIDASVAEVIAPLWETQTRFETQATSLVARAATVDVAQPGEEIQDETLGRARETLEGTLRRVRALRAARNQLLDASNKKGLELKKQHAAVKHLEYQLKGLSQQMHQIPNRHEKSQKFVLDLGKELSKTIGNQ